jgi:hypothetical protein
MKIPEAVLINPKSKPKGNPKNYGPSPFFVVMNGGSAIKRDLELYAPSVHARPVFSYTVVTVFGSFS